MQENEKDKTVFFHKDCPDGVMAAAVCYEYFGQFADYIPITYGDKVSFENCKDKLVVFVDFFPDEEMWENLLQQTDRIIVCDHHNTAKISYEKLTCENKIPEKIRKTIHFTENMSGSKLTFAKFFPNKKIPEIINRISDADLFTFEYPDSPEVSLAVKYIAGNDVKIANTMLNLSNYTHLFQAGFGIKQCLAEQEKYITNTAKEITLFGVKGLVVNATNNLFKTNVGHALAVRSGTFGAVYEIFEKDGKDVCKISFRSLKEAENVINVREFAEKLGGGGHDTAASATISFTALQELLAGYLESTEQ